MLGGVLTTGAGATYVKPPRSVPLFPPCDTMTSATPDACWAVVAAICESPETTTSVAATPPRLTVAPAVKFVPAIVTRVPPSEVPVAGVIERTDGPPVESVGEPPHDQ